MSLKTVHRTPVDGLVVLETTWGGMVLCFEETTGGTLNPWGNPDHDDDDVWLIDIPRALGIALMDLENEARSRRTGKSASIMRAPTSDSSPAAQKDRWRAPGEKP